MTQQQAKSNHVEHSLVQALRAFPGLAPFPETELIAVVADSANLRWAAGTQVIASGSESDGLYVVLSGQIQVREPGGTDLNKLGPGDYVGEFSLLLGTPRRHDVIAIEDSEVMVVPKERIRQLLDDHPELAREVRSRLEKRLAENARAGAQPTP
jgi:trk system potassium uptake protein TrkA